MSKQQCCTGPRGRAGRAAQRMRGAVNSSGNGVSMAEITGLHFEQSKDLLRERFAVRAVGTPALGTSSNSIADEGFDPADHTVTTPCDSAGR